MYRLSLLFLFFVPFFFYFSKPSAESDHAADDGLEVLKQHVTTDILAARTDAAEVIATAGKMKPDGSWADIDYTDKTRGGWPVNLHNERLNAMAVLYRRPGSRWTGDTVLARQIVRGLDFWLQHDFICPNWWYPEIGVPKVLGPAMILMEDKLTPAQKSAGIKILERARIGMTGQNKVWLSGNVVYRSLLTGDVGLIKAAVKAIQEEVVVSEAEGIQPDYSFHQHGPQQQFGNYGAAYAGDILKWASILQGTVFQFEADKVAILRNYLLQGMRWIIWKNKMDISACGRQLFPEAQTGKAASIGRIFAQMPIVDPALKSRYATALDDFSGDIHFWKSDMTVHRRANFYASVKMSSNRVGGAESCNDENLQGYHLGDGATYFYQSNNEYTDIFPYWDWKMIPGTTTFHDEKPLPVLPCSGYRLQTDFVGGVSNSVNGIATLAYVRDSLSAQKSWFFFEDAIACLGACVHSEDDKPVVTTVNQSFLHGNVVVKQGSGIQSIARGEHTLKGAAWVLHDGWGYYFPGSQSVTLSNRQQPGDWHSVLKRMPSKTMQADMFTLWFDHGSKPASASYAYYVFPGATASNLDTRGSALKLLQNTASVQAVESSSRQMAGIVFAKTGSVTTSLLGEVDGDQPCVVMLSKKNGGLQLVVSDPTQRLTQVVIRVRGRHTANTGAVQYDAAKGSTVFNIPLPQGAEAGKSVVVAVK